MNYLLKRALIVLVTLALISPSLTLAQTEHQKTCVIVNMKSGSAVTGTFIHAGEESILVADEGGKLLTLKREDILNFKFDPLAGRTTCPSSGFTSLTPQPTPSENKVATATAKVGAAPLTNSSTPALNNTDILEMHKAGLGPAVILAKIKGAATSFDTSTAALKTLKEAGLTDEVILAVVESSNAPRPSSASAPSNSPSEASEVKIIDGTQVEVELQSTVSGQQAKVGDIVDFTVIQPVEVNGVTVIAKGAPARARITTAKSSGHWGRTGKLEWAMQDTQAVDGSRVSLRFGQRALGGSKGGTVAVAAVATTVLLGPIGLLWGLKKGKAAVIPAGNKYTVFVHGDTKVKAAKNTAGQ